MKLELYYSFITTIDRIIGVVACQHEHYWANMGAVVFDASHDFSLETFYMLTQCKHAITEQNTTFDCIVFDSYSVMANIVIHFQ